MNQDPHFPHVYFLSSRGFYLLIFVIVLFFYLYNGEKESDSHLQALLLVFLCTRPANFCYFAARLASASHFRGWEAQHVKQKYL